MGQRESYLSRGGRADKFLGSKRPGSSNAAGSRPVVPFRDTWVQNDGAQEARQENPNPGVKNMQSFISE